MWGPQYLFCFFAFRNEANMKVSAQYGANKDKEWVYIKFKCFILAFSLVKVKYRLCNSNQSKRRVLHNEMLGVGFHEWFIFGPIGNQNP